MTKAFPEEAAGSLPEAASDLLYRMRSAANNKLPGQHLFQDFISEEEERQLIDFIETCEPPWHLSTFNGPHRCLPHQAKTIFT